MIGKALTTIFAAIVPLLPGFALNAQAVPPRPNIIFILCDDLGPGDLGFFWQNQRTTEPAHATPHLDAFAAEGLVMDRHYTGAPVCAPSRASLLLGQHQGHAAIRDNQFDKELPDTHTLGTVLQEAGYTTAVLGKWGLQGDFTWPAHPLKRGFDFFFGYIAHRDAHFHYPKEQNQPFYDGYTDISNDLDRCYSTDLLTARTKKWIQDQTTASPSQPFFIYLSLVAPHAGLRVPTDSHLAPASNYPPGGGLSGGLQWLGTPGQMINTATGSWDTGIHPDYANETHNGSPWPAYAKRYATMVRRIDDAVEDIIQTLQDLNIDQNTLIVFTSDNGVHNAGSADPVYTNDPTFFDSFGPYDGIKRDVWEGGFRTTTLVRWPGTVPAAATDSSASQFHDWMATFCDLAGVPVPSRSDGVSLVPTLTQRGTQNESSVYTEYYESGTTPAYSEFETDHRGQRRNEMQAVLIGDYKGVRYNIASGTTAFRVYDTLSDPKEAVDLAGQANLPTQQDFHAAGLRQRRINVTAPRPYDDDLVPPVTPEGVEPGLEFTAHEGIWPWVPRLSLLSASQTGEATGIDLGIRTAEANIGLRFSGYLHVPTSGDYTFYLQSGGRAIVRLHKALLLEADAEYAHTEISSGTIRLQAGLHPVSIDYIQASAPFSLELSWQGPGISKAPVPETRFYRDAGGSLVPEADFLWLPLDENGGTFATNVSNRIVGTLEDFASGNDHWITGAHGYALDFDGTDDLVSIYPGSGYPPTGGAARTITAWIKPDPLQPEFGSWLSYGTAATGERFTLRVDNVSGSDMVLRCEIQGAYILGSTPLDDAQWHHVAVVVDDLDDNGTTDVSEVRFFVDGNPDPITTGSGTINTGATFPLTVGGSAHDAAYQYAGGIDDVRIYPEALNASTIAGLAGRNAYADAWHFRQTGNPAPESTDWSADDEKDGFTRFMEFAMGGSIHTSDSALAPRLSLDTSNQFQLQFRRRKIGLAPESYVPEVSSQLLAGSWQPAEGSYSTVNVPEDPHVEWVTLTLSVAFGVEPSQVTQYDALESINRRFFRIRLVSAP